MLSFGLTMIMLVLLGTPHLVKTTEKIQISQNKCSRYCLRLDNRSHAGVVEFTKLYWLPTKERVYQCICVNIFKFFNDMSPEYTSEVFRLPYRRHNTRASRFMLDLSFRKYCFSQKTILPQTKDMQYIKLQKDTDDLLLAKTTSYFQLLYHSWCICIPFFIVFPKGP